MLGLPKETHCTSCGKHIPSGFDDYTVTGTTNPITGQWVLSVSCSLCESSFTVSFHVRMIADGVGYGESVTTISVNEYQRANLLWLFQAIGYGIGDEDVEPFTSANTGDWLGEVAIMLNYEDPPDQASNHTLAELRQNCELWRSGMKPYTATESDDPAKKKQSVWMDEEDIAAAAELLVFKEGWFPKDAEITRLVVSGGARVDIEAKVPIDWKGRRVKTSWERLNEDSSDD